MVVYRLYINGDHGYEQIHGNLSANQIILILDSLILGRHTTRKILVIANDLEHKWQYPAFLSITDDYLKFKESIGGNVNGKVKRKTRSNETN